VADGTADAADDVINYAIAVHNAGNMTLTGAAVSDLPVSGLTRIADLAGATMTTSWMSVRPGNTRRVTP